MEKYNLKPPFEIYHNGMEIADQRGHICSAESPEIAEAIVRALESSIRLASVPPVSSQERTDHGAEDVGGVQRD